MAQDFIVEEMGKRCFDFGDFELCVDRSVVEAYASAAIEKAVHDFADLSDHSQTQQRFLELVETYDKWERPFAYLDDMAANNDYY